MRGGATCAQSTHSTTPTCSWLKPLPLGKPGKRIILFSRALARFSGLVLPGPPSVLTSTGFAAERSGYSSMNKSRYELNIKSLVPPLGDEATLQLCSLTSLSPNWPFTFGRWSRMFSGTELLAGFSAPVVNIRVCGSVSPRAVVPAKSVACPCPCEREGRLRCVGNIWHLLFCAHFEAQACYIHAPSSSAFRCAVGRGQRTPFRCGWHPIWIRHPEEGQSRRC